MITLHCIAISPGIAAGPIYIYDTENFTAEKCTCSDPAFELQRLNYAITQADRQLHEVYSKTLLSTSQQDAAKIFEAHMLILQDPEVLDRVHLLINTNHFTAEYACYTAFTEYGNLLSSLKIERFAESSFDLRDVGRRVLRILQGKSPQIHPYQPSIIVAEELTPSDVVGFDDGMALAFCTARGGPASHLSILSKAMGIPAVAGVAPNLAQFKQGQKAILDGITGIVILDPDKNQEDQYSRQSMAANSLNDIAFSKARNPAASLDHHPFKVVANIGSPEEAETALDYGAEGIGLLRTEFLFLERDIPPTQEEQYGVYRKIIDQYGQRPVVVRTLDVGGDKPAPFLKIAKENNPFLGLRGTRLALKWEEVFQTQLMALLRAGAGANLKLMFPLIGTLDELRAARENISICMAKLDQMGLEYNRHCEIGLMIEIPSAAIMADVLAPEVDFFSIGTNDLTQYTLAADRTNSQVAEFADALDPAVLRLIDRVIKAAHESGKWVGLCGEMASDPTAVPVLMGFHLDEFSMNARSIPLIKEKIRGFSLSETEKISSHVLGLPTARKVRQFLDQTEVK